MYYMYIGILCRYFIFADFIFCYICSIFETNKLGSQCFPLNNTAYNLLDKHVRYNIIIVYAVSCSRKDQLCESRI